jgi:predicted permease
METEMTSRFTRIFSSRKRWEHDLAEELRFHIERQTALNIAAGMLSSEAHRLAILQLGATEGLKEACREQRRGYWFESWLADVHYGLRGLRKNPSFAAVAILSLALGIGVNIAIFTLAQEILLQKLAVPHPDQLRLVNWTAGEKRVVHSTWGNWDQTPSGEFTSTSFAYPVYQELRRENTVLGDLFAFKLFGHATISADGQPEQVQGEFVSGNFYQELGVGTQIGRPIQPADDATPGAGAVVVLSDAYWARRFARSPSVIGASVEVNRTPVTIIGVNPPGFTGAAEPQSSPEIFLPFSMQPVVLPYREGPILTKSAVWWMLIMGRAKPGVSDETARASLNVALDRAVRNNMTAGKDEVVPRLGLGPGSRGLNSGYKVFGQPTYILMALAGVVLLLACANLANLLLARASARQREMSVRLALGAGRARLVQQVMTESLLLAAMGGLAGLFLGFLGRDIIPHLMASSWEPAPFSAHFGWRIFAFCAVVSLLCGLLFGLAPAWQATRLDTHSEVMEGVRATAKRSRGLAGKSLGVFQVALSLVLVAGAGLFVRTLLKLSSIDPGFRAQSVLLFDIDPPAAHYPPPEDIVLHRQIEQKLASVPGLESITLSGEPLVADDVSETDFIPTETPKIEGLTMTAYYNGVGHDFFSTMSIPILYGRGFDSRDTETSPKVAVVNQQLVKKFFAHANPIGKTFNKERFEIVGVCANTRYQDLRSEPPPTFFVPYRQMESAGAMTYEIRTRAPIGSVLPAIRKAVQSVDKDLPLISVRTQTEQIANTLTHERIFATLTAGFGVLALILASIGIYGLMAYNVSRRTNEIGIRMALGAQRTTIGRMILRETFVLVLVGIAIGAPATWAMSRVIASLLFGLSPHDPLTLGGVVALLFVAGILAGYVPSRRATHLDPMAALRHE